MARKNGRNSADGVDNLSLFEDNPNGSQTQSATKIDIVRLEKQLIQCLIDKNIRIL